MEWGGNKRAQVLGPDAVVLRLGGAAAPERPQAALLPLQPLLLQRRRVHRDRRIGSARDAVHQGGSAPLHHLREAGLGVERARPAVPDASGRRQHEGRKGPSVKQAVHEAGRQ